MFCKKCVIMQKPSAFNLLTKFKTVVKEKQSSIIKIRYKGEEHLLWVVGAM